MKRSLSFVIAVVLLLVASVAFATVQRFSNFSADVPTGWITTESENGTVSFVYNGALKMTIFIGSKGNKLLSEIANEYKNRWNGQNFGVSNTGTVWWFDYNANGSVIEVRVFDKNFLSNMRDNEYCLLQYTGELTEEMSNIIASMTFDNNSSGGNSDNSVGSSGGGCDAGMGLFVSLFAVLSFIALRKK